MTMRGGRVQKAPTLRKIGGKAGSIEAAASKTSKKKREKNLAGWYPRESHSGWVDTDIRVPEGPRCGRQKNSHRVRSEADPDYCPSAEVKRNLAGRQRRGDRRKGQYRGRGVGVVGLGGLLCVGGGVNPKPPPGCLGFWFGVWLVGGWCGWVVGGGGGGWGWWFLWGGLFWVFDPTHPQRKTPPKKRHLTTPPPPMSRDRK